MKKMALLLAVVLGAFSSARRDPLYADSLPDTRPLEEKGDLAAKMVAGIGKYLDRELAASVEKRKQYWKPNRASWEQLAKSVEPNRQRLKKIIGVVDERVKFSDVEYVGGPVTPSLVAETELYKVQAIRWPVLPGVDGEGLLLEPKGKVIAQVVAIPDADWTPEQLAGLAPGVAKEWQVARRLAEHGCRVIVPVLIDRKDEHSANPKLQRATNQPHREFIYRMSYEMGRHIIGYEVQKVLAATDWFTREKDHAPVGVWGLGEGACIALYAAACDTRIDSIYLDGQTALNSAPIYRNIWGQRAEFGDDCILYLLAPRKTYFAFADIAPVTHPVSRPGRGGAAPYLPEDGMMLLDTGNLEFLDRRSRRIAEEFGTEWKLNYTVKGTQIFAPPKKKMAPPPPIKKDVDAPPSNATVAHRLIQDFLTKYDLNVGRVKEDLTEPKDLRKNFDPEPRQHRQFDQLVAHVQKLWRNSEPIRATRFAKCDYSSPAKYAASIEPIRDFFWEQVIGKLPAPDQPVNPKSREIYDTPKWKGYEVTLDLYPDVFAYGILLLPKDLKEGEKRPVVVCQHGLEGRPTDVCNPKEKTAYYNSFGAQLANLGFIVYAPQNPYIGKDDFRVLQRKANPLKLSLFSFIVRQHERTLDWLATLPNVAGDKIAFYGLSYGGKTAMRVPAIVKKYCLSICSGDFNEWIGKNVSIDLDRSYMWTIEYEMYEFDLGHTFNYAEMAYLIAPRPFMVERGHDDGVGIDEMVAYEFAKVRYLYENRLKLPGNQELEFFVGGHVINGKGTFAFLKRHLNWPPDQK
jgi:dienelactone hydrolase